MDQEESQFFLDMAFDNEEEVGAAYSQGAYSQVESPQPEPKEKQPPVFKAFNPYEYAENLPPKEQQKYLNMMMHNKSYMGLTHFINFDKTVESPQFFNSIDSQSNMGRDWTENPLHLDELFENENPEVIKRKLQEIQKKINEINKKTFSSIHIAHLVLPNFSQNFDNFLYLNSHINFIKDLELNMLNFAQLMKGRAESSELIVQVYEFWMKAFENFVMSIKKHSERYTLNFVKNMKEGSGSNPSNQEGRSTTSSRILQVQKRKQWKASELQMLQKVIQNNPVCNQATINKIAEELNRTPTSVSSKIQKLVRTHKETNPDYQVHENMTLLQKIVTVLKNYPNGLSRENVIERINQHYEMGYDFSSWSKSVAQILSSKAEFVKIKGTFSLNGQFKVDLTKKAFKDKVVNCLASIAGGKGDLKKIVDEYIRIYGTTQGISILSEERRKTLQASISKSLCRYDIFNKENSKTVYKLRQFCNDKDYQMEIESFLA